MTKDTFQEGRKAYCVWVGNNGKIDWTVFQVVRVLPKSLRLIEEGYEHDRLKYRNVDGCFYDYRDTAIKPSRKSALESAINKKMTNLVSCRKRMTEHEKDLELLQHELLNLKEPTDET